MGRSCWKEIQLSEKRNCRKFPAQQKLETALAGLRGEHSVRDVCRTRQIAETLYYFWRDKLLAGDAKEPRTSARPGTSCGRRSPSLSARSAERSTSSR